MLCVVAIQRHKITGIDTKMRIQVYCATKTNRIAVARKRGIRFITITESVVGALCTGTHGEGLIDIIFFTDKKLIRSMRQFILTVISHFCMFVIEEMVFYCSTQFG